MKSKGSTSEFISLRNQELRRAFNTAAMQLPTGTTLGEICQLAVKLPASRFWVSEERAALVLASLLREETRDKLRQQAAAGLLTPPEMTDRRRYKQERMRQVVSQGSVGEPASVLTRMIPERRRMYLYLLGMVKKILERSPEMPLRHAVNEALLSEAPEFFISPKSLRPILSRYRAKSMAHKKQ